VVTVTVYVEGGGDTRGPNDKCRKGFSEFLKRAGLHRMPRIVPCGSRERAYGSFCKAIEVAGVNEFIVLLVDSEGPVGGQDDAPAWQHLKASDNWPRPPGAMDDQAYLMVQCMEAWFLADKEYLAAFYGQGFIAKQLPKNKNVEQVLKSDVMRGLKMATRNTKKGEYSKGSHSFEILEGIDSTKVKALPHAAKLLAALEAKLT
jgi:hypothetical protein